jgi:hypothetical protein
MSSRAAAASASRQASSALYGGSGMMSRVAQVAAERSAASSACHTDQVRTDGQPNDCVSAAKPAPPRNAFMPSLSRHR